MSYLLGMEHQLSYSQANCRIGRNYSPVKKDNHENKQYFKVIVLFMNSKRKEKSFVLVKKEGRCCWLVVFLGPEKC
jgi:hypothetical protein